MQREGWGTFVFLFKKVISRAFLDMLVLRDIFHCYSNFHIFLKSLFIWSVDTVMSLTTEKVDVPSENSLVADEIPSTVSLIYTKKNKGPKLNPVGHQQAQKSMFDLQNAYSPFFHYIAFLLDVQQLDIYDYFLSDQQINNINQ